MAISGSKTRGRLTPAVSMETISFGTRHSPERKKKRQQKRNRQQDDQNLRDLRGVIANNKKRPMCSSMNVEILSLTSKMSQMEINPAMQ